MSVSPARKAAFEILLIIEKGGAHSDDLLRGKHLARLSAVDAHLATALVLGVLRWQIVLDQQIRTFLTRPNLRLDAEIQMALRLGAFQLICMERIPAHAAIDESVEMAKLAGHRFAARMVNAVLRKLTAVMGELSSKLNPTQSAEQAHPAWMVERWRRFYGSDAVQAICGHGQQEAKQMLRVSDQQAVAELDQSGVKLEPGQLLSSARAVVAGDSTTTEALRAGRARFQDEGSQLVAEMAGHGDAILDCCAAPGGKTMILAERNPRAKIVACDQSPQRLARLRERLTSLGKRIECRLADAAELAERNAYDLVLVDAPCSGTGTMGRNPEIRHRLQPDQLPRQALRQTAIVLAALRAVRKGGRVVYSTCSIEPEENEAVVTEILNTQKDVRLLPSQRRIAALADEGIVTTGGANRLKTCITPEGYLRLLPGLHQTDGFFVALLEKN